MLKKLRILLFVLVLSFFLFSTLLNAQDLKSEGQEGTDTGYLQILKIDLPAKFFDDQENKNVSHSLVSHVGKVFDTSINLNQQAYLESKEGFLSGKIRIYVAGVRGLILYFKKLALPEEGELFYRNSVRGVLKKIDKSLLTGGPYSFPLIEGDYVDIIWNLPERHLNKLALELSGIGVVLYPENTRIGGSGACEVNVNCPEGSDWKDQRDAVVRILVRNKQSVYWCTGVLVNNTSRDKTPYILTANHCGKGATPENVAQWQFFFNYEADDCPNPIVEPEKKMSIGGLKKAASDIVNGNLGSDFYLLTLLQGIPTGARAYFSGWSRIDEPASHGVCIHHPQGDLKKISTFSTPLVSSNWENTPGTHWKVIWSATASGHGVTEGGSSGSPLFNPDGLLVGTLTGGQASCDSASLNQPDYFGKFSYHWDSNGTSDTLRLSPFLDPLNTGLTTLEGTPLAIEENPFLDHELQIVPNPVIDVFSISGLAMKAKGAESANVLVYDIAGRQLINIRFHVFSNEYIHVKNLNSGVYWVRIEIQNQIFIQKIVKL